MSYVVPKFETGAEYIKYAIDFIIKQGEGCTNGKICVYRNDGLKCLVGSLISDDVYEPALEGTSLSHGKEIIEAVDRYQAAPEKPNF